MKNNERIIYLDFIKGICILNVFYVHYFSEFSIYSIIHEEILKGFSGKFSVIMFLVISGYLSSKKSNNIHLETKCISRRYLELVFPTLIVSTTIVLFFVFLENFDTNMFITISNMECCSYDLIKEIFNESFMLGGGEILPQTWCLKYFIIGYTIMYITNDYKYENNIRIITVLICFIFDNGVWIASYILGCLLVPIIQNVNNKINDINNLGNFMIKLFIVIICFVFIRRKESHITFIIDAIVCFIIILFIECSPKLKNILNGTKLISKIGTMTLEILLLHPIIYKFTHFIIGNFITNSKENNIISFIISSIFILIFSYILKLIDMKINNIIKKFNNLEI